MRLRHIPGSEEAIAASPYVLSNPCQYKGQFKQRFGNQNPIEIEIGMGKGKFIIELAQRHPQINYLGIERYPSVLLHGIKKQESLQLPGGSHSLEKTRYVYSKYHVRHDGCATW